MIILLQTRGEGDYWTGTNLIFTCQGKPAEVRIP